MSEIVTVCGTMDAGNCGMILSHEHMFIDLRNQALPEAKGCRISDQSRAKILQNPYCSEDNLVLDDIHLASKEAELLIKNGCRTVVDCTPDDIGRDPLLLKLLSEKTGLNIVMGCGWYTEDTHSHDFSSKSAEFLAEELISEIRNGVGNTGIRPGVIGEIGTSKEVSSAEWKAIRASAIAQKETGLALQVHIYPWSNNGIAVAQRLMDLNVAPERIVICHSDVCPDWRYIRELLDSGVYVQLDNFGKEFTPGKGNFSGGNFATDEERALLAAEIIQEGFGDQLLLTNDICLKCMTVQYGGEGYSHIFKNIIPMISANGISLKYLRETIMRQNPLRMLTGYHQGIEKHKNFRENDNMQKVSVSACV